MAFLWKRKKKSHRWQNGNWSKPASRAGAPTPAAARQSPITVGQPRTAKRRASYKEQRAYVRTPVSLEAVWEEKPRIYTAHVSDISIGGCYVDTIVGATVGEVINSKIQTPTGSWIKLQGEIVHYKPRMGFGLRFLDIAAKDQSLLALMIDFVGGESPAQPPPISSKPTAKRRASLAAPHVKPQPVLDYGRKSNWLWWIILSIVAFSAVLIFVLLNYQRYASTRNANSHGVSLAKGNVPAQHAEIGDKFAAQGKWAEAAAEHGEAVLLEPTNVQWRGRLGKDLAMQSKWEEAEVEYREAVRLDPDNPIWHDELGNVLRWRRKFEEAVAEHREAIRLQPNNAQWHCSLALDMVWMNKEAEAKVAFLEAIRLDPKNAYYKGQLQELEKKSAAQAPSTQ